MRQVGAGGCRRFSLLYRFLDLLLNFFEIDVEVGEYRGGDTFALTNEAEQDMLGTYVLVVQTGGFFPRHLKDFPNSVGKIVSVHRSLGVTGFSLAARGTDGRRRRPASVARTAPARSASPDRSAGAPRAGPGAP